MSSSNIVVSELTDDELGAKLRELGESVGPIQDTTRRVYEKKLERLMAGVVYQPPQFDDEGYSDTDEPDAAVVPDEPVIIPPAPVVMKETTHIQETRHYAETRSDYQDLKRRPMSATTRATWKESPKPQSSSDSTLKSASTISEKPAKSPGLSRWVQLGMLVVVAVIIFLIFQNMEPAAKSPFGRISQ